MDRYFKNTTHVNKPRSTSYLTLKRIGKIRHLLDQSILKILMQALLLSRLDYCNGLLLGTVDFQLEKLQKLQSMACRLIFGLRKSDQISDKLQSLHWLKIREWKQYKITVIVFQCLQGTSPKYLRDLIPKQTTNRNLRSAENHKLPVIRSNTAQRYNSLMVSMGPRIWNALPADLRCTEHIETFKNNIKTHLFKVSYNL